MEAKNIIIRESVFDDCQYFDKWEQDPNVTPFFTMNEDRSYEDVVTEFIKDKNNKKKLLFTICLRNTNEAIGRVIVRNINTHYDSLEISRIYIGDVENRGKGYGEETLKAILDYAFITLHMERVNIRLIENSSHRDELYSRLGFQFEGVLRNAGKKDGRYINLKLMSILRSEYFKKNTEK
ncbi:MAG: GNAT family N-acetyltransferase [Clostridia bacterium]|nr:GNAT family N-acetyltransferase [Clostridia bacterium]